MVLFFSCLFFCGVSSKVRVADETHQLCLWIPATPAVGLQNKCTGGLSNGPLREEEQGTTDSC